MAIYKGRIERHIKPTLGEMLVRDITSRDIEKAMHDTLQLGEVVVSRKLF